MLVLSGGTVRVTGSGLGCPDWPLCHGQFLPGLDPATRIEWLHRLIAIAGGLSLAGLVAVTLASYRHARRAVALALAAGVLYVLQAVLGAIVVLLELPHTWVTAHLANAEILLAVLTALAVTVRCPPMPRSAPWTSLLFAAAVGTFVVLLSGAYVRGADASTACTTWPLCDDNALPAFGAQAVHMAHRWVAALVGVVLAAACVQAWRHRREAPGLGPLSVLTALAFLAQVALGAANPLTGFSPWALGAHPAVASLVWCLTVALTVVAWHPTLPSRALVSDMVALTKPAIMSLLLLTALGGMLLAARGVPPFALLAATLVGGAAASGGASALNHYFTRDIDELMRRTRRRPLPAHRVSTRFAVGGCVEKSRRMPPPRKGFAMKRLACAGFPPRMGARSLPCSSFSSARASA